VVPLNSWQRQTVEESLRLVTYACYLLDYLTTLANLRRTRTLLSLMAVKGNFNNALLEIIRTAWRMEDPS